MTKLTNMIRTVLTNTLDKPFVSQLNSHQEFSIRDLKQQVDHLAGQLADQDLAINHRVVGIAMRSCVDWLVSDFAILLNQGISLPVPLDFADQQLVGLLGEVDYCIANDSEVVARLSVLMPDLTLVSPQGNVLYQGSDASLHANDELNKRLVAQGIIKIIHTSGTTSAPKGVMIYDQAVGLLVDNLITRCPQDTPLTYLSLVPMSLLIEQVLGIYMPLITGGKLTILPASMSEFGSHSGHGRRYLELIKKAQPNFIYLPPKLLEELDEYLAAGHLIDTIMPTVVPHIITGGAKVDKKLLQRLARNGIQVYEAYGLSENSSVISINSIHERKIGSAGRLLPGVKAKLIDGELCINSPTLCAGYYHRDDTSCDIDADGYLHTGDIAHFDEDEFLYITGRKKHVIILSNARNVSPEWVEGIIKAEARIDDVVVFGDGMDGLGAVVMPAKNIANDSIDIAMAKANEQLPLFARIINYKVINDTEEFRSAYYTVTGRPKRGEIFRDYQLAVFNTKPHMEF